MITGRNYDQPINAPSNEGRNELVVAGRIAISTRRQHQVVVFAGNVFDAPQNRREERIGDVNQKKPDHVAPQFRRSQRSGTIIGPVAELINSGANPNREMRADPGLAVDYPRYRFEADVGMGSNVMDCRSAVLSRRF
jgi:hypothetical protein